MFKKMLLDYGKKFTDQWAGASASDLIQHWATQMADFTGPEIARGLAAMEARDWPPSLPEFKKMCRPPVDATVAYYEALAGLQERLAGRVGKWSSPAVFWAAMTLSGDLGSQTYAQVKPRWEKALSDSLALGAWDPIPEPMASLPAPGTTMLSREDAERGLRELNASGVLKRTPSAARDLRWAHKIIDRAARGDKTVEMTPLNMARQALGMQP